MRSRSRAIFSTAVLVGASLLLRACEAPTARKDVATVNVTPAATTLRLTQTRQLSAATLDDGGAALTGRGVTWASDNLAVATVNGSGLVSAVAVGTATITATSEGIDGTAAVTVTVVPIVSVLVAPATGNVTVGLTQQLTATPRDSVNGALTGRIVTWESSDEARATVSGTGLVTGVGAGDVTITATSEGVEGESNLTIVLPPAPVDSVAVTPAASTLVPTETVQLTAAMFDSVGAALADRAVTWESSSEAVATVDGTGLVTAVAVGVATITATSEGVDGTATITVEAAPEPAPVDSVAVSPSAATRYPGQTVQLTATMFDSVGGALVGRAVTWESSSDAIATVDASGLVTAVAVGVVTITATSEAIDGTATITVDPVPVSSVEVTPDSAEVEEGETQQYTAVTRDSAGGILVGRTVVWSSLDGGIASVDVSGLATALNEGLARIVATSEGRADTARLSVTAAPVPGEEVVGPFDVLVTGVRDNGQGVATDGVNALYALQGGGVGAGGNSALSFTIVDSTGAVLVAPTPLDNVGGDPPAAAYGGGKYLVTAWIPGTGPTRRTVAWLVEQDGSSYGTALVLASGDSASAICGVSYAAGSFGVTYIRIAGVNANGDSLTRVYGRAITTAGAVSGELAVSPSWANCGVINNRSVGSDGAQWLAAWTPLDSATNAENGDVQVRTIAVSGTLGTVHTIRSAATFGRSLSVASRSTGGWVVALGEMVNEATADFDAYLQALASDGSVSGGVVTIDNTVLSVVPTVAEWTAGFALLYIERPATGANQVVRLRRYDSAMAAQGGDLPIAGADGSAKIPYGLALAGGTRFFIALEFYPVGATLIDFDQDASDFRGVWVRP